MNEHLIENCDFDEDDLASFQWESDCYSNHQPSQNQPSLSDNDTTESLSESEDDNMDQYFQDDDDQVLDSNQQQRRAFQMFWCGQVSIGLLSSYI